MAHPNSLPPKDILPLSDGIDILPLSLKLSHKMFHHFVKSVGLAVHQRKEMTLETAPLEVPFTVTILIGLGDTEKKYELNNPETTTLMDLIQRGDEFLFDYRIISDEKNRPVGLRERLSPFFEGAGKTNANFRAIYDKRKATLSLEEAEDLKRQGVPFYKVPSTGTVYLPIYDSDGTLFLIYGPVEEGSRTSGLSSVIAFQFLQKKTASVSSSGNAGVVNSLLRFKSAIFFEGWKVFEKFSTLKEGDDNFLLMTENYKRPVSFEFSGGGYWALSDRREKSRFFSDRQKFEDFVESHEGEVLTISEEVVLLLK